MRGAPGASRSHKPDQVGSIPAPASMLKPPAEQAFREITFGLGKELCDVTDEPMRLTSKGLIEVAEILEDSAKLVRDLVALLKNAEKQ